MQFDVCMYVLNDVCMYVLNDVCTYGRCMMYVGMYVLNDVCTYGRCMMYVGTRVRVRVVLPLHYPNPTSTLTVP